MKKEVYDHTMQRAREIDKTGASGKQWLANLHHGEIADLKAVAQINGFEQDIVYLQEVNNIIAENLEVRLSY